LRAWRVGAIPGGLLDRFTARAREPVVQAAEAARTLRHSYIGTKHTLLGLLCEEQGAAAPVLESLGATVDLVRAHVVSIVGAGEEPSVRQLPLDADAKNELVVALEEVLSLRQNRIGTERILLALLRQRDNTAKRVLAELDADPMKIRDEVLRMLSDRVALQGNSSCLPLAPSTLGL
jgi:ATP-dependent Clp protease ATP-binding subunit ClpC